MSDNEHGTVRVMIITKDHRIEGDMRIAAGGRLSDALNSRTKGFYAVTDATIYRVADDHLVAAPPFIAVAREAITAIFPIDESRA